MRIPISNSSIQAFGQIRSPAERPERTERGPVRTPFAGNVLAIATVTWLGVTALVLLIAG